MSISPIPLGRPRVRRVLLILIWLASLAGAFAAGAYAYRHRTTMSSWLDPVQGGQVVETSLYNLVVERVEVPAHGRDGAIDALGGGVLFVNRVGEAWFIDQDKKLNPLPVRVPINVAEFEADPYNANTILREQFAVKDIFVQTTPGGGIRLLASYNYWHSDRDCYALRVSVLETTQDELTRVNSELEGTWRTIFETTPCRPLSQAPNGKTRNPTLGAGGRLAALSSTQVLLTVGGFGRETATDESVAPPTEKRSYGNTILIDLSTGESRDFTRGHRNPQGLAVSPDGTVWLTDHGARGGDELNRIVEGSNYGHPVVTYGTEYGSMVWRRNPRQGHHDGFEKPTYAWVPSIGVSQLAVIQQPLFANWQGDLLVSSLKAQSLFRVRVEDGRAVFAEPILIGHRIRDIAEIADGTIVLKTDDGYLLYIRPIDTETLYDLDLPPAARGEVLAAACAGCHAMAPDGADSLGPSLWGVVGRRIASRDGYPYSPSLRALQGAWTPEALGGFLSNPAGMAPGTTMLLTSTYSEREVKDLVAYLERLR